MGRRSTKACYFRNNRSILYSIVLTMFGWELPDGCNSRIFYRDVITTGQAGIFWDKTFECFVNTRLTGNSALDMYGFPHTYNCIAVGYQRTMPANQIAICYNSIGGLSGGVDNIVFFDINRIIEHYADLLTDIDIGIRNEVENTKHPAVITVNDQKYVKSAREMWRQADDGEAVIMADNALFDGVKMQVFPLPRETFLDDKQKARIAIFNDFLARLGVNSLSYEKSERLITSEAAVNVESLSLPLQNLYIPCLECCESFYQIYGFRGVKVHLRTLNTSELYNIIGRQNNDA